MLLHHRDQRRVLFKPEHIGQLNFYFTAVQQIIADGRVGKATIRKGKEAFDKTADLMEMLAILRRDIASQYLVAVPQKRENDEHPAFRDSFSLPTCLDKIVSMVCSDGMSKMTHRTTFALDEATAQRLKRLAARWDVSQAEVVRRSVERAEKAAAQEQPDPSAMLRALFASGGGA